ncbi:DsbC family protein [Croceicoccus hydrothermalis]|jgi:thiol:disulfide interchange protein DsbC|uniref:DsbC family protein n=1 Tax=Croceicoccus hydrothermalis TaxID=2867964 RepID=UPI001EFA98B2|nr:DsbC family protein [Croceicoccus hydrothermalis]
MFNSFNITRTLSGSSEAGIGSRRAVQGLAILGAGSLLALGVQAVAQSTSSGTVQAALGERLPKTQLTAVDCEQIEGLCEVQAGSNLFYTDASGRYLIIGRVYDMETKQDLTAARLLEINPDMLVGAAASSGASAGGEPAAPVASARETAPTVEKAALEALPADGAIRWGRGRTKVTVFSDFRCGYCKQLHETLSAMNVEVVERPISILGTRMISDAVVCASDRRRALGQAYAGEAISNVRECDTSGLDANEAFARQHGFTGTPVIVRSDGAVLHGARPRDFLETWLKGENS